MAVIDQYFVYVMILDYVLQLSALAYPIYIFKNDQDQFYVFIAIGIGATAFRSLFLCLAGCCGGKVHWTWYGLFMLLRPLLNSNFVIISVSKAKSRRILCVRHRRHHGGVYVGYIVFGYVVLLSGVELINKH
ncbi:hypothetical protein L596_009889 [Steinernema carpocapsae]|uniref:Uncharacterized protein n=1 Tax=Steinernema carpocapsae TaxID=34508 RepID=A0A4V6XWM8_STECR|nr:hypothetical protein L596_009889 [Steinernema carpocapsae]